MIAVDLSNDVVIPQLVTIVGALVAGSSAVIRSWIENKDARARGDRKLDLARQRTEFAKEWIEISEKLKEKEDLRTQADKNLAEAVQEAERAFYEASADTSTALLQLRRLLMLVRRRNPASYVVTGLFLFLSVFIWLLICIPAPEDDGFSIVEAVAISIAATFTLRVVAGLVVGLLENVATRDGETIATLAVRNNVVTLTTKGPHGFALDSKPEVVVDASDDRFDGTFTVEPTSDRDFTFPSTRWAADVNSLSMRGWVCGDRVGDQLRRLFLIERGRRRLLDLLVSGLFLASVVGFSIWAVSDARSDLDDAGYPLCRGEPYDGGYFGDDDGFESETDAIDFLRFDAPVWDEPGSLPIGGVRSDGEVIRAADGSAFVLDEFRLRYENDSTVLYRKTGDNRLAKVDDPCEPQEVNVRIDVEEDDIAWEVFVFFDDSAGYLTGDEPLYMFLSGPKESTQKIRAFFGPDGRLIPVCDQARYPEIQPCLEERSVYFDSGLDDTVDQAFRVGTMILGFAIGTRLLIWVLGTATSSRAKDRSPDARPA